MTAPAAIAAPPARPYLTTREAAAYLGFETPSAVRAAIYRGELVPDGAGPRRSWVGSRSSGRTGGGCGR